jgi:L-alanine-DL-glutamate epimerase-like enolase superfamily enzyme
LAQGGAAVAALVERDLRPILLGAEADRIEALRQRPWRWLHYGCRGGFASLAISAVDTTLWE